MQVLFGTSISHILYLLLLLFKRRGSRPVITASNTYIVGIGFELRLCLLCQRDELLTRDILTCDNVLIRQYLEALLLSTEPVDKFRLR